MRLRLAKDNLEQPSISHPAGGVLVAAGEMTATILQGMTTTSPIIMAFGGMQPDASKHHTNMAGLVGDCVHVAQHHLQQLKGSGRAVTVMYDPEHPGDATKPKNNVTNKAIGTLNGYTALPILPSDLQDGTVDTATLIGKLTDPLGAGRTQGFMMVPNAAYFECAGLIADAIDNAGNITMAYYSEFYYYTKHNNKNKPKVYGFNVPATYRVAASWVNYLLIGYWTVATMPTRFPPAITDPYP
jgi:hypothetical protein